MRIALITQYFNVVGGIESLLKSLIPEYERRGHEIDVIVTREQAAAGSAVALGRNTREVFLPLHPHQGLARWAWTCLPDTIRLAKHLRKARIDVAHSHLFDWSLIPQVVAACEITRTPLVQTWHSVTDFNSRARRLMVRALRGADALTAVTGAMRQGFEHLLPAAKDAVIISNGIDVETAQKAAPYQHGRPYIFCACRLTLPDKAVDALITSFGAIAESHPEVDLLVAGEGPSRDAIAKHISLSRVGPPSEIARKGRRSPNSKLEPRGAVFRDAQQVPRGARDRLSGSDGGGASRDRHKHRRRA